jgi:hypothetical protein
MFDHPFVSLRLHCLRGFRACAGSCMHIMEVLLQVPTLAAKSRPSPPPSLSACRVLSYFVLSGLVWQDRFWVSDFSIRDKPMCTWRRAGLLSRILGELSIDAPCMRYTPAKTWLCQVFGLSVGGDFSLIFGKTASTGSSVSTRTAGSGFTNQTDHALSIHAIGSDSKNSAIQRQFLSNRRSRISRRRDATAVVAR